MKRLPCLVLFTCLVSIASVVSGQSELFPFVVSFDAPDNATNISRRLDAPAGKHGFVRVENGHFATDRGRIQFWGTNTCFGANFLDKKTADRVADRLARFGINCVRMHHLDMHDLWGGPDAKSFMTFDPAQLDKLDYFFAALKKRGIYVEFGMHCSRSLDERDGFPANVDRMIHDKGIDQYYRPIIEANKKYARDFLSHVNPYTGLAYKDDPAVALLEINNEDSILSAWGGWGGLEVIRDPFLAELRKEWNDWLLKKYKNDAGLGKAWNMRTIPSGDELLKNGDFPKGYVPDWDGWKWDTDDSVDMSTSNENGALRIDLRKKGNADWVPQLTGFDFAVKKGRLYTLTVKAKASRDTTTAIGVRENHAPFGGLGFDTFLKWSPNWQTFKFLVTPTADDEQARVSILGFEPGVVYEIESISLKPGGNVGLEDGQNLASGTVPVIWKKDIAAYPEEAVNDFCDFLFDIDKRHWDEMERFMKEELKVRQPVTGTQLEFSSVHAQAKTDFCDIHSYWHHPTFTAGAWDPNHWYLHDQALVNYLDREILVNLATKRVYGKPYTLTEYNHPYPNRYFGEGLPLMAAFAAFQGWDGVFPFAYTHSNDMEPRRALGFFDTAGNSVQMAHMIACHALFCDGYNKNSDENMLVAPLTEEKEREIFRKWRHPYHSGFQGLDLDSRIALTRPTAVDPSGKTENMPEIPSIPADQKKFEVDDDASGTKITCDMTSPGRGFVVARNRAASLFTGFVDEGEVHPFGDGNIRFGKTNLGVATVTLTRLENKDGERRLLLVATGEMTNTDMHITKLDGDKITVGNNWGRPPVLCEGIPATLTLDGVDEKKVRVFPLDENGNRREALAVEAAKSGCLVKLSPEFKTIWYEIAIAP